MTQIWTGVAVSALGLALALPAVAHDRCGNNGDGAGGAFTGAVIGGAAGGPPGAIAGAVIGSAAGDQDCDRYGYNCRSNGNATGGAVTGAIVGGAAAGPPGAIAGAIIGAAAGDDSDDCRGDYGGDYGNGYGPDDGGGYYASGYGSTDERSDNAYDSGFADGYEAGQLNQLNGMDRGYRVNGYYARRDDYRDHTYDERDAAYRTRGDHRRYRASCWDPCRSASYGYDSGYYYRGF